jgi:hypothetical protein
VSLDRKRWLLLAQDLKFNQLDIARKQADTWRAGLATLTTLLTGVLIVKGKSDASVLPTPYQISVAALLAAALALLLGTTIWLSRALAGPPGERIILTGEGLEEWTAGEVRKVTKTLFWAPWMAATSVGLVAAAVGVTWFAPAAQQQPDNPLVRVTVTSGQSCGALVGETKQEVILTAPSGGTPTAIPIPSVLAMTPVTNCSLTTAFVAPDRCLRLRCPRPPALLSGMRSRACHSRTGACARWPPTQRARGDRCGSAWSGCATVPAWHRASGKQASIVLQTRAAKARSKGLVLRFGL